MEKLSTFFSNVLTGNNFLNNIGVHDFAAIPRVNVGENIKVKGEADVEDMSFHNLNTPVLNVTDSELLFEPDSVIKLKDSPIAFKVRDIFEVLSFMKFMSKVCGNQMENCDLENLLIAKNEAEQKKFIAKITEMYNQQKEVPKKPENTSIEKSNTKNSQSNNFTPKEKPQSVNSLSVNPDVEKYLANEMKKLKEHNNYEMFLSSPELQNYVQSYYYG
jgi:hypothetical protein